MRDLHGFGTHPSKLHRLQDPDTSVEAAKAVNTTRLERQVYEIIAGFGDIGCISDDVRYHPNMIDKPYSSVTARYKALMEKGFIEDTGERRKGASGRNMRVMRVNQPTRP